MGGHGCVRGLRGCIPTTIAELEQCGFIRAHKDFTRAIYGETCQLAGPFTLFWPYCVEEHDEARWWSANRGGGSHRAWTGREFDKSYSLDLAGKTEVFAFRTGADKVIHTTLVMPGPISRNQYADAVQSVATAEDLFVP